MRILSGHSPEFGVFEEEVSLAMGNFDGLHLGHQRLLSNLKTNREVSRWLLTFDPHPRAYFSKKSGQGFKRIFSQAELLNLLCERKLVDGVWVVPFDKPLASLEPGAFLENYLSKLPLCKIVVGHDFAFGKNRQGGMKELQTWVEKQQIELQVFPEFSLGGDRVSSSRIKDFLARGDVKTAERFLGYKPFVLGQVQKGQQLGSQLGFPTANLPLHFEPALAFGVYLVRVQKQTKKNQLYGVANLGLRPTVNSLDPLPRLEVHLFLDGLSQEPRDLDSNLYGENLKVEFLEFIREEKKFESLQKLRDQITLDVQTAKERIGGQSWNGL